MPITNCEHTDRKHGGRGLCGPCYMHHKRNGLPLPATIIGRSNDVCGHRERKHHANGRCRECYQGLPERKEKNCERMRIKRIEDPQAARAYGREREPFTQANPKNVDHDHSKPKGDASFRGILCRTCNVAAGMLRDSHAKARLIADYLERFEETRT